VLSVAGERYPVAFLVSLAPGSPGTPPVPGLFLYGRMKAPGSCELRARFF